MGIEEEIGNSFIWKAGKMKKRKREKESDVAVGSNL